MGILDSITGQSGGGLMGGLPASWQYQNPDDLSPEQRKMMALVETQNPERAGFNPLPARTGTFPAFAPGSDPMAGAGSGNDGGLPFATGGDPMAGAGSGNDGGLPAPTPMPPVQSLETQGSSPAQGFGMDAPRLVTPQPAPTFGAGAAPIFATPPGSTPGNPALAAAAPARPAAAPAAADDGEDAVPAKPANAAPIAVGSYQMPRIGSQAAFNADPAALPDNSQPAQGQGLPIPGQASPSVGEKLMAGYQNLKHGGGLIGSVVAAVTGNRNDPTAVATQQQTQIANMTARALVNKGVDPQVAVAAVQPGNGEVLKSLLTQVFGSKALTSIGEGYVSDKDGNVRRAYVPEQKDNFSLEKRKDALGNETFVKINKATGEVSPGEAGGAGGAGAGPAFGSLLAPGMTYDPNKSGPEYLAQFGPEVQSAAKAYMRGDVMPTGNARNQSIATFAKTVAQKYGQDMGIPVNDSTYAGKRKMQTDLASSSNSSMGGILSNGESSFSHLAEATSSMSDLGNASHNFWGGGVLAHLQNSAGNAMGGSDIKAKIGALVDNLGKYGAEATKFYAGTGGGVEERTAARKDLDPNKVSGEEMASYAEKEKSLMLDRLNTKFQQIRDTYGEEEGNAIIKKHLPGIERNIATIDANIAKMRGTATSAEASAAIPPMKVGQSTTVNGVSIKKVAE